MTGAVFVLVSGPPASGKSTLARELGLPLVAKVVELIRRCIGS